MAIALPYLRRAEGAVASIKPKDINELKTSRNPVDTTKVIFDAVQLVLQYPIGPVIPSQVNMNKQNIDFIKDSFDDFTKNTLTNPKFLTILQDFSEFEKDNINDETCELMEPYLNLKLPNDGS